MSYGEQLAGLTRIALEQGVPPGEIILCLELTKIELANQMFANAKAEQAGPGIHLPDGGPR